MKKKYNKDLEKSKYGTSKLLAELSFKISEEWHGAHEMLLEDIMRIKNKEEFIVILDKVPNTEKTMVALKRVMLKQWLCFHEPDVLMDICESEEDKDEFVKEANFWNSLLEIAKDARANKCLKK